MSGSSILFASAQETAGPIALLYIAYALISGVSAAYAMSKVMHTYAVKRWKLTVNSSDYNGTTAVPTIIIFFVALFTVGAIAVKLSWMAGLLATVMTVPVLLVVVFAIHFSCVGIYRLVTWTQKQIAGE